MPPPWAGLPATGGSWARRRNRRAGRRCRRGSLRVVSEWATRRRRAERAGCERLRKPPPARVLGRLLLSERDQLIKDDAITVARVERSVPTLITARDPVEYFHRMLRERDPAALPASIIVVAGSVILH